MKKSTVRSILNHVCLILLSLVMIYPVIWWVFASFKTTER